MASKASFDVYTEVDLQEVDNALNQAKKEVGQRYDFKGSNCTMELERGVGAIKMQADDAFRMQALVEVLQTKLAKRGVPLKNIDFGDEQEASSGRVRREAKLMQGIATETARKIVKSVKDQKLKKVQVAIQEDRLRVSGPSKDDLQAVITFLKSQDFGVELMFGNYR